MGALKEAARKGVRGDTRLGHLSNGDIVFPAEHVDAQTRKVIHLFMQKKGLDPKRFTVGHPDNHKNPHTRLPQFEGTGGEGEGEGPGSEGGTGGNGPGGGGTGGPGNGASAGDAGNAGDTAPGGITGTTTAPDRAQSSIGIDSASVGTPAAPDASALANTPNMTTQGVSTVVQTEDDMLSPTVA